MDDKTLLELAAKAAGIDLIIDGTFYGFSEVDSSDHFNGEVWLTEWNPLDEEGDALRLAIKLSISIMLPAAEDRGYILALWPNGQGVKEPSSKDPYTATRRAIVRAAAAIGEQMP